MGRNKGINLISLIITIIILLILTGISITISTRGSVSQRAKNVVNKANNQTQNISEQENEIIEGANERKGTKSPTKYNDT
mgnify:FL=1